MSPKSQLTTLLLMCMLTCADVVRADDTADVNPGFEKIMTPFLTRYCLDCHGSDIQEADFRLDQLSQDVRKPKQVAHWTKALRRIRSGEMPPSDEPQPNSEERRAVVNWFLERLPKENENTKHWAYVPLVRPSGSSIDEFVIRRLRKRKLDLSPTATPERLLRRIYLDLIGLPPNPNESKAFADDPSEEHLSQIVDRLLESPRYGERWGRHWLDLARYADSNGLHEDTHRPHAWRYRDYVIASFNSDKPYGQFIREQLAGDEIAPNNLDAWIATGFCRNGPSNEKNVAVAEVASYRYDQLDDILATTAQVFLGQTIQCARCHDHKLEPFELTDYYRLLAVFDNSVPAYLPVVEGSPGHPVLRAIQARDKRQPPEEPHIRALTDRPTDPQKTYTLLRGNPNSPGEEVTPGIPAVLSRFAAQFKPIPSERTSGRRTALANWLASPENPLTWRVMANRVWQFHFGRGLVRTSSNFGQSGEKPTYSHLLDWLACELRDGNGQLKPLHRQIVLSHTYRQSSAFRNEAARVDPENLTLWRYPPHRLEAEVIRDSILATSGRLNLKMGGPGVKPRLPAELLEQSKRNEWPNVEQETAEHWRRSVYVYCKRQLPMPLLALFDAPDAAQSCAARFSSTTPTQALVLLNDAFVNEQARHLANDLRCFEAGRRVEELLHRVWAVSPSPEKIADAEAFVAERIRARQSNPEAEELAITDLAVVLFNSSQFVFVD